MSIQETPYNRVMAATPRQIGAFALVLQERARQKDLKAIHAFRFTCADDGLLDSERLAVLLEEVGEVSRAVLEYGELVSSSKGLYDRHQAVKKELVQVCAVALAWLERFES